MAAERTVRARRRRCRDPKRGVGRKPRFEPRVIYMQDKVGDFNPARARTRALLTRLVPAVAFGVGVWIAPSIGEAAPTCTTKPAVCARLAAQKAARTPAVRPAPTAVASATSARCTTKPV